MGIEVQSLKYTIYECLIDGVPPQQAIHDTEIENLSVLPSHIDLVGAEIEMLNMEEREKVMQHLLRPLKPDFDYILIDCSPSLGLITVNALTASDSVIIPVQCEYFALEGISKLLNTIKIIKSKLNPSLDIEGFYTMYDNRLRWQIRFMQVKHFQNMVFENVIFRNVRSANAKLQNLLCCMIRNRRFQLS